jgi:hypothetical protein
VNPFFLRKNRFIGDDFLNGGNASERQAALLIVAARIADWDVREWGWFTLGRSVHVHDKQVSLIFLCCM